MRIAIVLLPQVWLLIDYGATVNIKDVEGKTPMDVAIEYRQNDIIRLLRFAGADLWVVSRLIGTLDWPPQTLADDIELCDWLVEASKFKVRPLAELCKFSIRASLRRNIDKRLRRLPIPSVLQEFCTI